MEYVLLLSKEEFSFYYLLLCVFRDIKCVRLCDDIKSDVHCIKCLGSL
jgi:hypothetical protein